MSRIIGFAFFLLFLVAIAFVSLKGRQAAQLGAPGGGASITGISWRPIELTGETIPEDSGIYIRFELDGSIDGHAGCNRFFGSLQQSDTGIEVGSLGVTRMACAEPLMRREAAFLDAVERTKSFDSTKDRLRLLDDQSEVLAEFIAGD